MVESFGPTVESGIIAIDDITGPCRIAARRRTYRNVSCRVVGHIILGPDPERVSIQILREDIWQELDMRPAPTWLSVPIRGRKRDRGERIASGWSPVARCSASPNESISERLI